MSVEIPADLKPLLQQFVASGRYQSEQDVVTAILRLAVGSLSEYEEVRSEVKKSLADEREGRVEVADFAHIRQQLD